MSATISHLAVVEPLDAEEVIDPFLHDDRQRVEPQRAPLGPRRIALLAATWLGVLVTVVAIVLYGVGPMLEQRDQRSLLSGYRVAVDHAANEASGLAGVTVPTKAPSTGSAVGIIEIGRLHLQQVVVEGVGPQQTRRGPGHVPGTAGLGQPGNAAVVGRHAGFGGVFGSLGKLRAGDELLVTTTQGQTVYRVSSTQTVHVTGPRDAPSSPSASASTTAPDTAPEVTRPARTASVDDLYRPTSTDQLTLVSSASALPWATDRAVVVQARLLGTPFTPTPQNGRTDGADGRAVVGSAWSWLLLALIGMAGAVAASVVLHRRFPFRSAYVLSAPLLVLFALLFGEAALLLVPAWA